MYRLIIVCFLLMISVPDGMAQCPDLGSNTSVTNCSGNCVACPGEVFTFSVNDNFLPSNGTIDYYISSIPGFIPPAQGSLLHSASINGNIGEGNICPNIEAVYIDACTGGGGGEGDNEFIVVSSGSGFYINNFGLDYDMNNNGGSIGNGDVNLGGFCTWAPGNASLYSGCPNVFSAGPGDFIPPNSLVIFQTSSFAMNVYNISSMCGLSECIYVVSSSCDRNQGAYSNCDSNGPRTTTISLTSGCSDMVVHNGNDPGCNNMDGQYILGDGVTYGNNGCDNGPTLNYTPAAINATVSDYNHSFTMGDCGQTFYIKGILNSSEVNTTCCMAGMTPEYEFFVSCPDADVTTTNGNLCPGDCVDIFFNLMGGSAPYTINISLVAGPINFPVTIPGFDVSDKVRICYGGGGLFPTFNFASNTLNVPDIAAGFSGSLVLNSFTDDNGCQGSIAGNSVAVSFLQPTDAFPATLEECEVANGNAFFDLTQANSTVNGGTGLTVNYYLDMAATMQILTPGMFPSMTTTLYAVVNGMPCQSDIVPVDLVVVTNGNAGMVTMACSINNNNQCTLCDDDGTPGEDVNILFYFPDNQNYEVVIDYQYGMNSSTVTSNLTGPWASMTFFITENTTFTLSQVTLEGDCPDMTDLGPPVEVIYALQPEITGPGNLVDCGSLTLPAITGNHLSGNEAYYTLPGGMGTMYNEGDIINMDLTLYIYDGISDCFDEEEINISIAGEIIYDEPSDVIACGAYTLPSITGTNVGSTASYFTMPGGMGAAFMPGQSINFTTDLYISDPFASCNSNEPQFNVTIEPGPVFTGVTDTMVCDTFIVPPFTGMNLSGNAAYYSQPNEMGVMIEVGDTITSDSIIYLFDTNGTCDARDSIMVSLAAEVFPGVNTMHTFCEGNDLILNFMDLIGGADTSGVWTDISGSMLDLSDTTMVDASGLAEGVYYFYYEISNNICPDTAATLTINITDDIEAGNDGIDNLCNDNSTPVDLFSYLGLYSSGGYWQDNDNSGIDLSDPSMISVEGITPGLYDFQYTIPDAPSCPGDSSYVTLNIVEGVDAGMDRMISVCEGSNIDLADYLEGHSQVGVFRDLDMTGNLNGSLVTTSGLNGTYTFSHLVMAMAPCTEDEAFFTLQVASALNAGEDNDQQICTPGQVNLEDYVLNGDGGGMFVDALTNDTLSNGLLTVNGAMMSETYTIFYIVGDGISCPFDTALISLIYRAQPMIEMSSEPSVCVGSCISVDLNFTVGEDYNAFISVMDENGVSDGVVLILDESGSTSFQICNEDDGVFEYFNLEPDHLYTIMLDSIVPVMNSMEDCRYYYTDVNQSVWAEDVLTTTLDTVICRNDDLVLGGQIFNEDNPGGFVILSGNGSCDTLVEVSLSFYENGFSVFDPVLCKGATVDIGGIVFHENNPSGMVTLFGASANGCDSLIAVNIQFADISEIIVDDVICSGDTIYVNGNPYYDGNSSGQELISNADPEICDTLYMIDLVVEQAVTGLLENTFCDESEFLLVNGIIYDVNNPQGMEVILGGASNGCDSLIEIDLTYAVPVVNELTQATCNSLFSITVNGEVYDVNNPTGTEVISGGAGNGCDSIILVMLTYGQLLADYDVVSPECKEEENGTLTLYSIEGSEPYSLEYNGQVFMIASFPFTLELPVGISTVYMEDDMQCTDEIQVQIDAAPSLQAEISQTQTGESQTHLILSYTSEPDDILWLPNDGLSCNDCADPVSSVEETTTYSAILTYGNCRDTVGTTVVREGNTTITLPNIFSPNGDGINDAFSLVSEQTDLLIHSFRIYDRWGNLIFIRENINANDPGAFWNGNKTDGSEVITGVYIYAIEYTDDRGSTTVLTGDITLIR